MKLLSFQPFSLLSSSGGGRILRRLYQGHEPQILSLCLQMYSSRYLNGSSITQKKGIIPETSVPAEPVGRPWMRWHIRDFATYLRENTFRNTTINRICEQAAKIEYDAIHVVDHSPFSSALCNDSFCSGKSLWVSFHDHFSTTGSSIENTGKLWNHSDRRLVISDEIGEEYQRLFGNKNYEIITDGVTSSEMSHPNHNQDSPIIIYFAGLLHIDYLPLFKTLADALDILTGKKLSFKLILRGTQRVKFVENRLFPVEYRPVTLSNDELKQELDSASILYLPIKFTTPDFYLYSLSTKMVGYLGGSGTILYHGPKDSAVSNLLQKSKAAISCNSLSIDEMVSSLQTLLASKIDISTNAKTLAKNQFSLPLIQDRFWQQKQG